MDDFTQRMPRRRRIASRLVSVEAATYLLVVLVTTALILYFFIRGRT